MNHERDKNIRDALQYLFILHESIQHWEFPISDFHVFRTLSTSFQVIFAVLAAWCALFAEFFFFFTFTVILQIQLK